MRFIFTYCKIRILAEITAFLRFRYELLNKFLVLNHLIKVFKNSKKHDDRSIPLSQAFLP